MDQWDPKEIRDPSDPQDFPEFTAKREIQDFRVHRANRGHLVKVDPWDHLECQEDEAHRATQDHRDLTDHQVYPATKVTADSKEKLEFRARLAILTLPLTLHHFMRLPNTKRPDKYD